MAMMYVWTGSSGGGKLMYSPSSLCTVLHVAFPPFFVAHSTQPHAQ